MSYRWQWHRRFFLVLLLDRHPNNYQYSANLFVVCESDLKGLLLTLAFCAVLLVSVLAGSSAEPHGTP